MSTVLDKFNAARKFLIALLGAVLVFLQSLDKLLPQNSWVTAAVAGVTAALVWLVPNVTPAQ